MEVEGHAVSSLVFALSAGVLCQSLARHLRLPGIVLLLLFGVLLGPDGLGWVRPRSLGEGFFAVVDLSVAVILFEGALNLRISRLRREQSAIRHLVLSGAILTLGGAALAAYGILGWGPQQSVLFGSLVVVTGPTVIGPLLSEARLRPRVATVLKAEGVLIDPVGAILAVLVLEIVVAPDQAVVGATGLMLRVGTGTLIGLVSGYLLSRLLRIRQLLPDGHENIFVLAAVLLVFVLADSIVTHSGILAVTIAGVTVGNTRTAVDRDLREFKDQLTVLLIGLLFILLAADVRLSEVAALGGPGLAVVAVLILVVRPLMVAVTTAPSDLTRRERLFIAWIAPRGIVAAAIASLVAVAMEQAGLEGGASLRALVFLTITGTVLQAGLTGGLVARWLGVSLPKREGVAILGAQGLGMLLAQEIRRAQIPVIFLDSNPQTCRQAEEAGFSVIFGNALEERTLQRAQLERFESVVGLTPNQTVNAVFASRARALFGVERSYIAIQSQDTGVAAELVRDQEAFALFDAPHDLERWDVRLRRGNVETGWFRFAGDTEAAAEGGGPVALGEKCVLLAVQSGGRAVTPLSHDVGLVDGDRVFVALHAAEVPAATEALATWGLILDEAAPDPQEA